MRTISYEHDGELTLHMLSDLHIGSAYSDYAAIERDVERVRADPNARAAIAGDVFDMILPGDEKRFRVGALHHRVRGNDIVNDCLAWGDELLRPIRSKLLFISEGNHDNKVSKKHSFDPIRALCDQLHVERGDYAGLLSIKFKDRKPRFNVGYWHGHGGGATRQSAVRQSGKLLELCDGLDVAWTGHRHQRYACPTIRYSPTKRGLIERRVWLLMSGAYMRNAPYTLEALYSPGDIGSVQLTINADGTTRVIL